MVAGWRAPQKVRIIITPQLRWDSVGRRRSRPRPHCEPMKLNLETGSVRHLIERHEPGRVRIAGTWYQQPLIVRPNALLHPWAAPAVASLRAEDLLAQDSAVRILLLGTGTRQVFPAVRLIAELAGQGVGLEVMDSAAACRTYNVLAAEGREVAAALYLGSVG